MNLESQAAAEEFNRETSRYRSYEELIPIAYAELRPSEDSIKMSGRYVLESHVMGDSAKTAGGARRHQSAIEALLWRSSIRDARRLIGFALPD